MSDFDRDFAKLVKILLAERKHADLNKKGEKLRNVLFLLAAGVGLIIKHDFKFDTSVSDWDDWKFLNEQYLRNAIKKLQKQKVVEIIEKNGVARVQLTENGKQKVLEQSVDELKINRPVVWDGKWRLVLYDIFTNQRKIRDRLQKTLKGGGFYQLQESVYLHAFPCEQEIEFLRNYLGVGGEVRVIIAEKIENDQQFKEYFGVN